MLGERSNGAASICLHSVPEQNGRVRGITEEVCVSSGDVVDGLHPSSLPDEPRGTKDLKDGDPMTGQGHFEHEKSLPPALSGCPVQRWPEPIAPRSPRPHAVR